ncbi:alpha/beta fold hydrolase [Marinobacter sp. TBZ242]|uniref:Alpha/beta fold hydrolase n=1 Tax=Marinobacter azerbaijanicus TaxID=3050455 RepID=A0ABT7IA87_9GAMM|nr:alpha/beta fold hydrolase [Marinobacter sp. TBZ242]MDL0431087.1 alpha/beta fold hydrolase [Marinobacter sp. TBZ242]
MPETHQWINNNGVNLYVVTEGDPHQPALVLVHGYPDNHSVWDAVTRHLVSHYFVIRYDVRGAGRSSSPASTRDYGMHYLAADLACVVDTVIPGRSFHLAGHDWGSIQSWESVTTRPLSSRVLSYTTISGPCIDHVATWIRGNLTANGKTGRRKVLQQLASSWYVLLFQLPLLPEALWYIGLDRLWPTYLARREQVTNSIPDPFQKKDGCHGVKLYRANFLPRLLRPRSRHAFCPVQLIVPGQDNYVGQQLTEDLEQWSGKLVRRDIDAPHWVVLTHPEEIAGWIDEFARTQEGAT